MITCFHGISLFTTLELFIMNIFILFVSVQALHNGSGVTMTRRKYADKKKKGAEDADNVMTIDGPGLLYSVSMLC